jgi:hypothetical protein
MPSQVNLSSCESSRTFGERSRQLVASYGVEKCADDIVAACLAVSGRAKAQGWEEAG